MKKHIIRLGIGFFVIIALLTYFSKTIDHALLPQVKITKVEYGTIDGKQFPEDRYLVPLSSVTSFGEKGTVFVLNEKDDVRVVEIPVRICRSDDFYYEVTSNDLYSSLKVVWSVSKPIENNDRVYIEE